MPDAFTVAQPKLFTIGHSTRPIAEFIDLLQAHDVTCLVDIRTVPRSRHNPQFGQDALRAALAEAAIRYLHLPALGGLRRPRPDSVNTAWRNDSFRGFADYMQTEEFRQAIDSVVELSARERLALMCAEAVPWRCHRSLVADALLVRGFQVEEIVTRDRTRSHTLTPWAHVEGQRVTYPSADEEEAGTGEPS